MLIDMREVANGRSLVATVCIIGAGVAGITIARELEKQGIDTCVLESGGLVADDATRDLARGEAIGFDYLFSDGCRGRFFGGSSNCWGGWCRPLDAWDFERRDWIPHSGWPFGLDELDPWYRKAHEVLKLGPVNFEPAFWEQSIARKDVRRLPLCTGDIRDTVSQFSPPVRFGRDYRSELSRARFVRVFLNANVTQIIPDPMCARIEQVRVRTLTGRQMTVSARQFVLATGGIENARLLLVSNDLAKNGLGNTHGLVGRYFMDHPRMLKGSIRFAPGWSRNKLYDIKYNYMNRAVSAHGVKIAAQLALTRKALYRERLLNARVCFCSAFPGEGSKGAQALFRLKQSVLKKDQPGWRLSDDMAIMMRDPLNTFAYGFTRFFHPRALIRGISFQMIIEPAPNPDSRVMLSAERRDALGMPRVRVDWRLNDLVKHTADRTLSLIAAELQASGVAHVDAGPSILAHGWPSTMEREGTWHHMGTTRMHDNPHKGVVDSDGKVHGLANLYIAGSSVFPTAGANFPTITITALSLRLAEHLAHVLRQGLIRSRCDTQIHSKHETHSQSEDQSALFANAQTQRLSEASRSIPRS